MINKTARKYLSQTMTALLPLFLITASSCLKDPTKEDHPGTVLSGDDVKKAVITAWELPKGESAESEIVDYIQMNESVTFKNYYNIPGQSGDTTIMKNQRTTQLTKCNVTKTTGEMDVNLTFTNNIAPIAGSSISTKPYSWQRTPPLAIPFDTSSDPVAANLSAPSVSASGILAQSTPAGSVRVMDGDPDQAEGEITSYEDLYQYALWCSMQNVKCYNLQTSTEYLQNPDFLISQPNCGGIPNCKLKVNNVSFTVAQKYQDGDGTKEVRAIIKVRIAPQLPYLSKVISKCAFQMYVLNNEAVGADYCQAVTSFAPGDDNLKEANCPLDTTPSN